MERRGRNKTVRRVDGFNGTQGVRSLVARVRSLQARSREERCHPTRYDINVQLASMTRLQLIRGISRIVPNDDDESEREIHGDAMMIVVKQGGEESAGCEMPCVE
jgi:hypothetical protein